MELAKRLSLETSLRESEFIDGLESLFPRRRFSACFEVRFFGRSIDVVFQSPDGELIAVELKVHNWRRAIQQAMVHPLYADRTYIAVWHGVLHRIDQDLLNDLEIGLISLDGSAKEIKPAPRSSILNWRLKSQLQLSVSRGRAC